MLVPTCIVKFLELTLTVACLILHHYSYDLTDIPTLMLCSGTYIGFIVVLSGEIIGETIFAPVDLVQDIFFGLIGVALFSVSGGLIIFARMKGSVYPRTGDHNIAYLCGSLSILNSILLLCDLSLAYLDSEEFEDEGSEVVSAAADAYIDAWWSACGALLFGACGSLQFLSWRDIPGTIRRHRGQAAALCALAACILFIIDALLAICSAHRDGSSLRTRSHKPSNPCS